MSDLPWTIHLITEAPVLNLIRLFNAVTAPQVAPLCSFLDVAIFDEGGRSFRCTGSEVESHERLRANNLGPCHEFVGAELIGVNRVPCLVEHAWTVFFRPHSVEPVVTRNEIATGITNDRNSELPYLGYKVFAEPGAV